MSISVWGWGSSAISTWGWGGSTFEELLPNLLADYLAEGPAYSCVAARDKGPVLLRAKPDEIPLREVCE